MGGDVIRLKFVAMRMLLYHLRTGISSLFPKTFVNHFFKVALYRVSDYPFNPMKAILTSMLSAIVMASPGFGEEPTKNSAELAPVMAAVLANDRAYEEAYAKGDAEALAAFFTEDAEYTSDDGRSFSGNTAIKACLLDCLPHQQGRENHHPRGFGETTLIRCGGRKRLDLRDF